MRDAYDAFMQHEAQQIDEQLTEACNRCDDTGWDMALIGVSWAYGCSQCGEEPLNLQLVKKAFSKTSTRIAA